jgi:hypothetical protein
MGKASDRDIERADAHGLERDSRTNVILAAALPG